jgi:sulfite oxidase
VEGWIEIVCRCWDNSLNTQPLNVRAAWNWGLHVTSSAHRIKVYSVNKTREITQKRIAKFEQMGIPLAPLTRYDAVPGLTDEELDEYWKIHPRDVDE